MGRCVVCHGYVEPELLEMAHLVRFHSDLLPKDLLHELRLELQAFTGSEVVADDTTIVAIRIGDLE